MTSRVARSSPPIRGNTRRAAPSICSSLPRAAKPPTRWRHPPAARQPRPRKSRTGPTQRSTRRSSRKHSAGGRAPSESDDGNDWWRSCAGGALQHAGEALGGDRAAPRPQVGAIVPADPGHHGRIPPGRQPVLRGFPRRQWRGGRQGAERDTPCRWAGGSPEGPDRRDDKKGR